MSLGFDEIYDYAAGKHDWLAAGLPTEGSNAQRPRAGGIARSDVPTCRLDERLGEVRERAQAAGWNVCVAVNDQGIVFGLLREKELAGDSDVTIAEAMRPGPSTFRPHVSAREMAKYMVEHDLQSSPITTSDGRLVGILLRDDVVQAAESEHESHA